MKTGKKQHEKRQIPKGGGSNSFLETDAEQTVSTSLARDKTRAGQVISSISQPHQSTGAQSQSKNLLFAERKGLNRNGRRQK
jgi:hypothetical protein